jgi:hypothetical protein
MPPSDIFCIFVFIFFKTFLAQANSPARIANPTGTIIIAGPGNTIITIPISRTVKPMTAIISRFNCLILFHMMLFNLIAIKYSLEENLHIHVISFTGAP